MGLGSKSTKTVLRARVVVFFSLLFLAKLVLSVWLMREGFVSVSADEFARGILAAKWAEAPSFDLWADIRGTWLPLEKYLNGAALLLWHDVYWTPRVTVFLASCLTLFALFLVVHQLFGHFLIASLSALFVVFQPWYAWLSGTPMLEMYYFGFFFLGLYFLLCWLRERRAGYWFWAGISFFVASAFHVQSWTYINLVNLTTVLFWGGIYRRHDWGAALRLLVFYLLSNGFILMLSIVEYCSTGRLFAFFARHTSYSTWFYEGYNVSFVEKLLHYPKLLLENLNPWVAALFVVGLLLLVCDDRRRWKLYPLLLAFLALAFNAAMNVVSVPATAAPGRYALFYVMLLSPYIAYGACAIWQRRRRLRRLARYAIPLTAVLFLVALIWEVPKISDFPKGMSPDSVAAGRVLNTLLNQNATNANDAYMVELTYWEFLGVQLTAEHYTSCVFDREYNIRKRDLPSLFLDDPEVIHAVLHSNQVQYVALRDPELKHRAIQLDYLRLVSATDGWRTYAFQPR